MQTSHTVIWKGEPNAIVHLYLSNSSPIPFLLLTALALNLAIGVHDFVDQKNAPTQLATEFLVNAHPTWMTKMLFASLFLIASGIVMESVRRARLSTFLQTN